MSGPETQTEDLAAADPEFEADNDSLYVMPLSIVPLRTTALRRARMVKDSRLQTAIQMFADKSTGSGLLEVDKVGERFGWPRDQSHPDQVILNHLAQLTSFDIYSLRIRLRDLGVRVDSLQHLRLSETKRKELRDYMQIFTLPLVQRIYGADNLEIHSVDDIIRLFADPDTGRALAKLKVLSTELGIELKDIPKFLEDFSDIYMSLAYYQKYLDEIEPKVQRFIGEMTAFKENFQMRQDENLMRTCNELVGGLGTVTTSVSGRFEGFHRNTADMWKNINAEKFEAVRTLITSYHTTLGGVLCGLGLKMNTWVSHFPDSERGGLMAKAEVIMSSIRPGLEEIIRINQSGPKLPR